MFFASEKEKNSVFFFDFEIDSDNRFVGAFGRILYQEGHTVYLVM